MTRRTLVLGPALVGLACTQAGTDPRPQPVPVVAPDRADPSPPVTLPLAGLTSIDPAVHHSCALESGRVLCWGQNRDDSLGVGQGLPDAVTTPQPVIGLDDVGPIVQIATDYDFSCALTRDGAIYCWGSNNGHQLGLGDTDDRDRPTRVSLAPASRVITAYEHGCAVEREQRGVSCWGTGYGDVPVAVPLLASVDQFVTPGGHSCTLTAGAMLCWGSNSGGQIGNGEGGCEYDEPLCADCRRLPERTCKQVEHPTAPLELPPIAAIAASGSYTYALDRDGGVWQWGQVGQTMSYGPKPNYRPQRVAALPPIAALSAGANHACAHTQRGELWCWGNDSFGQLGFEAQPGESEYPQPRRVEGLPPVTAIAAGFYSTCALTGEAEQTIAWCWGDNGWGQLGDGTTERRHTPTPVRLRE